MKSIVSTTNAPAAIGPYSQAVKIGNFVFTSGQIPINPATGQVIAGSVEEQATLVLNNLKAVLEAAGSSLDKVVKTTVFIKDINYFAAVNTVSATFFATEAPGRSCVEVARLPKDVLVEIEAIAHLN